MPAQRAVTAEGDAALEAEVLAELLHLAVLVLDAQVRLVGAQTREHLLVVVAEVAPDEHLLVADVVLVVELRLAQRLQQLRLGRDLRERLGNRMT